MTDRVLVTGIGVVSPIGIGKEVFRDALREGHSGVRRIDAFDPYALHTRIGGMIDDEELRTLYPEEEVWRGHDRSTVLALMAAEAAYSDARLEETENGAYGKGVVVGSGCGPAAAVEDAYGELFGDARASVRPSVAPRVLWGGAAAEIGRRLHLNRINQTVSTLGASSLSALAVGHAAIRSGAADIVVVGGTEAPLTPHYFRVWDAMRVLTREFNQEPERASRPFARDRSGMVLSEGAAFIVLERDKTALERKADIYGEIYAPGESSDCQPMAQPSAESQAEAMERALANAGLDRTHVAHIQADACSSPAGDLAETNAIKQVFGAGASSVPVSSIKSMTGHCLGAAGMMGVSAVLLGMRDGFVPPTINMDNPDPVCNLDYVTNKAINQEVPNGLINAFSLQGTNMSVVVRTI